MDLHAIIDQFRRSLLDLPAEERAVLTKLAGKLGSLSTRELDEALASGAGRPMLRTGLRAGFTETEEG